MSRKILTIVLAMGIVGILTAAARPASAASIAVTTTADNDISDSQCTLREAIISINNNSSYHGCTNTASADAITLPVGTIQLTGVLPNITTRGRTIRGMGYNRTTIYGALLPGIRITSAWATFSDMTLRGFANAVLTVEAGAAGALSYVKLIGGEDFGCINNNGGSVDVANSNVELCRGFLGGALYNFGASANASIRNSTFTKCFSEHGLIANNAGTLSVVQSTIGGNTTGNGAAGIINFGGSVTITASTFAYDLATSAPGSGHVLNNSSGTMTVERSVIFGGTPKDNLGFPASTPDCSGTIISNGFNAIRSGGGCSFASTGDFAVTDPLLQPSTLVEEQHFTNLPRGGLPGRVYVPATNSPLLSRGPSGGLEGDERGVKRQGSAVDIGSVQRGTALFVVGNTSLSRGDFLLQNKLENLGFTVTIRSDLAVTLADTTGKTIVVVSETVSSGNVNTKLRDAHTGVLVNELALFDDMNMTTGANLGVVTASQVNVPFDAYVFNPLASAAGYFGTVATTTSGVNHGWGTPVTGTSAYAQNTTTASRKHAFYNSAGEIMVNNFQAPGHRVGNWFTEQAATFLTAEGHGLLDAAILLAAVPSAI